MLGEDRPDKVTTRDPFSFGFPESRFFRFQSEIQVVFGVLIEDFPSGVRLFPVWLRAGIVFRYFRRLISWHPPAGVFPPPTNKKRCPG